MTVSDKTQCQCSISTTEENNILRGYIEIKHWLEMDSYIVHFVVIYDFSTPV